MVSARSLLVQARGVLVLGAVAATVLAGQAAAGRNTAGGTATRVVARGETLSSLAASLGVSVSRLAEANGITDIDYIRAGARLVVPATPTAAKAPGGRRPGAAAALPKRLRANPARLALMPHFDAAAREFGVPADLLKALAWLESGWQNDKLSSARAMGIGQLMPATVEFVNARLLGARLDPARSDHNIRMSARFLAYLLRANDGDVRAALASYYQGLASYRRHGPLPQSRRYVANVLALRAKF